MKAAHDCDVCIQDVDHTGFVGGVSDGQMGCSTMEYKAKTPSTLTLQKSYFFFNDCVLAMGTNINIQSHNPVVTSIDQRLTKTAAYMFENGQQVYLTLHYTTLHYTTPCTLHYTTLHYTALHDATLHYTTLHHS